MKKKRTGRASYWGLGARTTAKNWGFGPVAGKGGKTTNFEIQEKDRREQTKSKAGKMKG